MEFHEYLSIYDLIRRLKGTSLSALDWYDQELKRTVADALRSSDAQKRGQATIEQTLTPTLGNIQYTCERSWELNRRPYYKIYPDLLPYFVSTKLDVPSEYFRLPFPAFIIRLPKEHNVDVLKIDDNHYVRTILVGGDQQGKHPGLVFGNPQGGVVEGEFRQIIIFIDVNELEPMGEQQYPILTYQQLLFSDETQTVEEVLGKNIEKGLYIKDNCVANGGIPIPLTVIDACYRIAVAVTFLATGGDKIVECDVLNRDLLRYLDAKQKEDTEIQERIISRAIRNHKHGWTMGREIVIPGCQTGSGEPGDGSVLSFQHQRGAHWHWVRHGPGKAMVKLMFFGQTTVRPDLPVNTKARRGYRTK